MMMMNSQPKSHTSNLFSVGSQFTTFSPRREDVGNR
jgi:hypothetical protein